MQYMLQRGSIWYHLPTVILHVIMGETIDKANDGVHPLLLLG